VLISTLVCSDLRGCSVLDPLVLVCNFVYDFTF
jgi:hypothetical protein